METQILKYWTQFQDNVYSQTVGKEVNELRDNTIINFLKNINPKPTYIADIGCGSGHLADEIKKLGYGVCGLDLPKVIAECKKRYPDIEFIEFNAEKDILSPVDVIIASEIVEHLADDFGFLQRCKMSTNILIITVPLSNYIHPSDHHMRAYSRYSMVKLLQIAGFDGIKYFEDGVSQYFVAINGGLNDTKE